MKRSFLYLALGALALTACTSEDVLEDAAKKHNAIEFEYSVNKLSRADVTSGNLDHFRVFGFYTTPIQPTEENPTPGHSTVAVPVFNDIQVNRQPNNSWSYTLQDDGITSTGVDDRYWVPNAYYYFFAYNCGNVEKLDSKYGTFSMNMENGVEISDRVLKINNYICDNGHQHDLIYAYATGATADDPFAGILAKSNGNTQVAFQFKHLLSKVQASFTSKFPEDYTVEITNVTIDNARTIGSYIPNIRDNNTTSGWTDVVRNSENRAGIYLLDTRDKNTLPITAQKGTEPVKTNTIYVIPYSYKGNVDESTGELYNDYVYLKFFITVKNKGQDVLSKELTGRFNPVWNAGYSYSYNVEISGTATNLEAIAFTTTEDEKGETVSGWNEGSLVIPVQ